MYAISGKFVYFLFLCHFHNHNCFVDCWKYDVLYCKLVTHYCFLYFKFLNRLRNFSCWSLNEVIYCDHSKVLQYNTLVLLHFIAASLADGCTQKSFFAITAEIWTRIWNYIWNRACVFCCCTQVCHLCYCLSMSTLSVVQLFLLQCVFPNLTTIK